MSLSHAVKNTADWRSLYPFQSHYFRVDGGDIHYVDEGEGRPVVMFHGNPTWSFMYRDMIKRVVADGGRAIAIDNLGCGLSDKPRKYPYRLQNHIANAEALLESLELSEMDIIAHDWGGAIGFGYAVRHPEKIRRMAAMNTAAFLSNHCPWRIRACKLPLFGSLAVRGFNAFAGAAVTMATTRPGGLEKQVKAGYLAPYDSFSTRIATLRFVQDIPLTPRHPTWPTILEIENRLPSLKTKPLSLCWGMRDFCFTPEFLDRWLAFFPAAQVRRFPACGHYLLEDAGDDVVREIAGFFR
ncbi:MAG: alpha/beta fold hydrolase [Lentisphaeria bacterium]|nr:alpha/beta fold hydrolase [Lentisphaeria bacterium]